MAKKTTMELNGVKVLVVTSDTLVDLVRRIGSLEKKVNDLQKTEQENFDSIVEHIGKVVPGGAQFKVFASDDDGYRDVVVQIISNEPSKD